MFHDILLLYCELLIKLFNGQIGVTFKADFFAHIKMHSCFLKFDLAREKIQHLIREGDFSALVLTLISLKICKNSPLMSKMTSI